MGGSEPPVGRIVSGVDAFITRCRAIYDKEQRLVPIGNAFAMSQPRFKTGLDTWMFHRQPFDPAQFRNLVVPLELGKVILWDSRFFIRITKPSLESFRKARAYSLPFDITSLDNYEIVVKPLGMEDLRHFERTVRVTHKSLRRPEMMRTIKAFKDFVPMKARFVLPCICLRQKFGVVEILCAVPSMGINLYPAVMDVSFSYRPHGNFHKRAEVRRFDEIITC